MPLYDILNEFQKGQSHMAAVVRSISNTQNTTEDNEKNVSGSKEDKSNDSDVKVASQIIIDIETRNDDLPDSSTGNQAASRTESMQSEDGVVIGIITLEDVIEELLQVSCFITFIILEFTGPLNHMVVHYAGGF